MSRNHERAHEFHRMSQLPPVSNERIEFFRTRKGKELRSKFFGLGNRGVLKSEASLLFHGSKAVWVVPVREDYEPAAEQPNPHTYEAKFGEVYLVENDRSLIRVVGVRPRAGTYTLVTVVDSKGKESGYGPWLRNIGLLMVPKAV